MAETLEQYQKRVKKRLEALLPIFARATVGDFSRNVKIPQKEDEFTDLYVGLQIMVEVVREQTRELKKLNQQLTKTLSERTAILMKEVEEGVRNEAILSSIGEGLIVTNKAGKIVLANDRALTILGYQEESQLLDALDTQIFTLIDEQGRLLPDDEHPLKKALKTRKRVVETDLWYKRADKTAIPLTITAAPVVAGNTVLGGVKVFRDITAEKTIERSKTEFVLLASHQLRTPVSIIKWYGQLLGKELGKPTPRQTQYLGEIENGTKRMNEVIGTLLDVAQIESGLLKYEPEPVGVEAFFDRLLEELGPRIKEKEVKVSKNFAPKLPQLHTDPKLLRMVLQNLLTNAIKYMDPGGSIRLNATYYTAGQKWEDHPVSQPSLAISVSDTGYGIPPEQQQRIFTKMFRATNIKDKPIEGTGIGLFITKSVIDFLGGSIWFKSQLGKGSTFYLLLPLRSGAK